MSLVVARGTATYATGKFGQGLAGGGGVLKEDTIAGGAPAITVEAWVKIGTGTARYVAAGKDASWWFGVDNYRPIVNYKASNGTTDIMIIGTTTLTVGSWYHMRLTLDAGGGKFYVNGVLESSSTTAPSIPTTSNYFIGGFTVSAFDWRADGAIDEFRLSNIVRNTENFTPPTEPFTHDSNTLALYHLDGNAATDTGSASTSVTPAPVTFADNDGTASDTYIIPTTTGVDYQIASVTKASGTYAGTGTVTVTAVAQAGYSLTGTTSWTHTFSTSTATVGEVGTPTDTKIIYSPYNWTFTATSAKTINAGAYLKFAVSGNPSTVVLTFDISANSAGNMPLLGFKVNGGPWTTQSLAATITLDTATGNNWNVNTVEMVVVKSSESLTRWSPQQTQVNLTGIQSGGTTPTFVAYDAKPLRGLAFGDSITEGIKVLGSGLIDDARLAWAYPLTEHLGAEIGVVGFGLQGWVQNGHGGVPGLQTAWKLQWSGQPRDFSVVPDFIVINMGTNQGTQAQIDATLRDMLATVPTCPIIVLRPWNGARATEIQAAITAIGNPRLSYVNTTGWWATTDAGDSVHPFGHINLTSLAPKTAAAIRAVLPNGSGGTVTPSPEPATTGKVYINKGGSAVAISARAKI